MSRLGAERESFTYRDSELSSYPARVNARLLPQFKGQTVRLTAKVIRLNGDTATVEASDGGQVSCVRGMHGGGGMHCVGECIMGARR